MSAKIVWDIFHIYWIDIYQELLDFIIHDTGKNFISIEFKQNTRSIIIEVKEILIEAYNSINKIEWYHVLLHRVYNIIRDKFQNNTSIKLALQIIVKTINGSASPDGIIFTLLVFRTYPRITNDSSPLPFIIKKTKTIRKVIKEV
jgi:hypothetical protein